MAEENIHITVTDEELDAAIAKADEALAKTGDVLDTIPDLDYIRDEAKDLGEEIEGIGYAQRRILSMVPGVREAYMMVRQLQSFLAISSPELAAIIGIAMIVRTVLARLEKLEEKMRKTEDLVMKYRGLGSRKQAREWLDEQNRLATQSYQGANP